MFITVCMQHNIFFSLKETTKTNQFKYFTYKIFLFSDSDPQGGSDTDGSTKGVARRQKKSRLPSYRKTTAASRAKKDNRNR